MELYLDLTQRRHDGQEHWVHNRMTTQAKLTSSSWLRIKPAELKLGQMPNFYDYAG